MSEDVVWETIPGFVNYEVGTNGEVRNERSGRILRQNANASGTVYVGMVRGGTQHHRSVALMVLSTFVPQTNPAFDTPIHLNGSRFDNRVDNLTWRPRWFAVKYNREIQALRPRIDAPIENASSGMVHRDSLECAKHYGVLESDLELSIVNRTYVWPVYQLFRVLQE